MTNRRKSWVSLHLPLKGVNSPGSMDDMDDTKPPMELPEDSDYLDILLRIRREGIGVAETHLWGIISMCLQVCAELRTRLMRNGRISEYRQTLTSSSSFTIPSCDNGRIMVIVIMALKTAKALPTQKGPVFPLVLVGPPKAIRIYPLSIGVRYSINIHKPSIIGGNAREIIPTSDLQMTDRRGEATHPMYQQMHQLFKYEMGWLDGLARPIGVYSAELYSPQISCSNCPFRTGSNLTLHFLRSRYIFFCRGTWRSGVILAPFVQVQNPIVQCKESYVQLQDESDDVEV